MKNVKKDIVALIPVKGNSERVKKKEFKEIWKFKLIKIEDKTNKKSKMF